MNNNPTLKKCINEHIDAINTQRPNVLPYLSQVSERDALLSGRIITAMSGNRVFQASISESSLLNFALIKSVGENFDSRLLEFVYFVGMENPTEVAHAASMWLVELASEEEIRRKFRPLF